MRAVSLVCALGATLLLGAANDKDPLAGYAIAGKPQRCVTMTPASSGSGLVIAANQLITYQESPRRLWVTHPISTCARMQPYDTLIVDQFGGQTCRGDRFRVLEQGISIPSATCVLGDFIPYDKVPKPKR